jgi:hypothetical protein
MEEPLSEALKEVSVSINEIVPKALVNNAIFDFC